MFSTSSNGNGSPLLSGDLLEPHLIDYLDVTTPPFPNLLGYYSHAVEEAMKVSSMKDSTARSRIQTSINRAKNLAVSYSRLYIGCPELLGSSDVTVNTSDLLSVIFSDVRSPLDRIDSGQGLTCPPGFVDEFFKDFDGEIFENIIKDLYDRLRSSVMRVSSLGNFQTPLRVLVRLVGFPNCAKALVNHPRWMSTESGSRAGRMVERCTILRAFLHISALPDYRDFRSEPDVGLILRHVQVVELAECESSLSTYKAMRDQGASVQLEDRIKHLEGEIKLLSQEKLCYEAQILRDDKLLR